jgi:AhpD family alkylhydroperoxidase
VAERRAAEGARVDDLLAAAREELPATMRAFARLHATAMADGALPARLKELIALAVSVCVHCEGCVEHHLSAARAAGASREEIREALGVAIVMGGGPAVISGGDALRELGAGDAEAEGRG